MKNTIKFILATALSALLCTACGGSDTTPNNATDSTLKSTTSSTNTSQIQDNTPTSADISQTDSTLKSTTSSTNSSQIQDNTPTSADNPQSDSASQVTALPPIPVSPIVVHPTSFMDKARQFTPTQVDLPKAESYLDAAKKDGDAQYVLSMMYRTKTGDIEHIVKGKKSRHNANKLYEMHRWSLKALESMFPMPTYVESPTLIPGDLDNIKFNAEKSLNWLNTAASAGIADAEFILGILYYHGQAIDQDTEKAQELIARAALHDLPVAQYFVGMFYELGIGTQVDKSEALSWLQKAADADSPDASFILALKYLDGIDVKKDAEKTKKYINQSKNYHAWSALLSENLFGDFEYICKNSYDKVEIDTQYADDCGGDYDGWNPDLSDAENEKRIFENHIFERTNDSLNYSVDYALAWYWLTQIVNTNQYFHANLLHAQTLVSSGCHAHDDEDYDLRLKRTQNELKALYSMPKANIAMADFANATFKHHYVLDRYDSETEDNTDSKFNIDAANEAYRLYQSAADQGYKQALCEMAAIYDEIDYPNLTAFHIPVKPDEEKAIEYYLKCGDNKTASTRLSAKADAMFKTDPVKSIPLYEKAAENGDKDSMLQLARMYHNGKYVTKDDNKSIQYYEQCTLNPKDNEWSTGECALELFQLYEKNNQVKSEKTCKLAYHIYANKAPDREIKPKLAACTYHLELLPRIEDLQTEIENEIALEKDKKLTNFFVYNSIIQPCNKNDNQCHAIAEPLYQESIPKAIRGITALVIGQTGKADLKLIENTYYYLAIYRGMNQKYIKRFDKASAVFDAIQNMPDYMPKNEIFFTWYLRQIPYAAKDVYNKNPGAKSWDALLKEADQVINESNALKTAFGYAPLMYEY